MSKRWEVLFSWDRLKSALKEKGENIVSDAFFEKLRPFCQEETTKWAERVAQVFMDYVDTTNDYATRIAQSFSYQMLLAWRYLQRYNYTFQFVHKRTLSLIQKNHPHPLVDRVLVALDFWLGEWDQALYRIERLVRAGCQDKVIWEIWVYITFVREGNLAAVEKIQEKAQAQGLSATDLLRVSGDVDFSEPWFVHLRKACAQSQRKRHERMKGLLRCMVFHDENDQKNRTLCRELGLIGMKEEAGGLWMVDQRTGISLRWLMNRAGFSNIPSAFIEDVVQRLRSQRDRHRIDHWWGLRIFPDLEMIPNAEESLAVAKKRRQRQKRIVRFEEKVIRLSATKHWDRVLRTYQDFPEVPRSLSAKRWLAKAHWETLDWNNLDAVAFVRTLYAQVHPLVRTDAMFWLRWARLQKVLGFYGQSYFSLRQARRFGAQERAEKASQCLVRQISSRQEGTSFAQHVRNAWAQLRENAWLLLQTARIGFADNKDVRLLRSFLSPICDDVTMQMVTLADSHKKLVRIHLMERLDILGPLVYFLSQMPSSLQKNWIFELGGTILGLNERALRWEAIRNDVQWFVSVTPGQQFHIALYHPSFATLDIQQRRVFEQRMMHYIMKYVPEEHIIRWVGKMEMISDRSVAMGQKVDPNRIISYMESMVPSVLRYTMPHLLEEEQRIPLRLWNRETDPVWQDYVRLHSAWGLFAVGRLTGEKDFLNPLWRLGVSVGVLALALPRSVQTQRRKKRIVDALIAYLDRQQAYCPHRVLGYSLGQHYVYVELYWYDMTKACERIRLWHRRHSEIRSIAYVSYDIHSQPQVWSERLDTLWWTRTTYS